jgi:hypothetical protein
MDIKILYMHKITEEKQNENPTEPHKRRKLTDEFSNNSNPKVSVS